MDAYSEKHLLILETSEFTALHKYHSLGYFNCLYHIRTKDHVNANTNVQANRCSHLIATG